MKNFTRFLIITSIMLMMAFSVYSQDVYKSANLGIGTTNPAQKVEVAGNNTVRIDGLIGVTYNIAPSANTSMIVYVNSNGDLYSIPNGSSGAVLAISSTGVPTWASTSSVANAWNFTGGNAVSPTWGTNYIGSNNSEPIEFDVNNTYAGVLDPTNENVYFGGTANGFYPGNDLSGPVAGAYNNVGIGTGALGRVVSGSWWNVGIGYLTLASYDNSTNGAGNGSGSTGVGAFVLNHSTGTPNEGFGFQANYTLTTGMNNTSIGFAANWSNSTGNDDVVVGDSAAWGNTAGGIVAIGTSALRGANTGTGNVAVGINALQKNTSGGGNTGGANTAVGYDALEVNTTSIQNNAFGYKTLAGNTSGGNNVAIGNLALNISQSGSANIAIGTDVLSSIISGSQNVIIGEEALSQASASTQNTGVGAFTLYGNGSSASYNVAEGTGTLYHNTGNYNTAIGYEACTITGFSGSDNVALGANALNNLSSGSNDIALGYQANIASGAISNAIAIGANASAPNSNSMVLGNSSDTALYLPGYTTRGEIFYTSETTGDVAALAPGTLGQVLTISATGVPTWSSAGGSGTVTSFSAGNLSPLFTTSVATSTTTPALSFMLSNAGAETILGNNTAIGATPTYFSPTLASALFANQGTTTTVLHGNAAGNPSWGAVNLTTDVTGTLPVTNGGTGLSTVGSNGQVLTVVSGVPEWATGVSSVTASGPLGISGSSSVPNVYINGTNGGVLYGTGAGAGFTGVGVAGQILESTGAGAPQWVNVSTLDTIVGDQWGSEYVITDSISTAGVINTITGTGLGTNPLKLAKQGAKNNQVLTWDSTANTWKPATPAGTGWQLTGNSGTTAGTNFIGTTDPNDLVFKTDDNEDMRISNSNGYVGMGTNSPQAALDVTSTTSGILIPRLASNPASPASAMMYYNTTSGCFMFYSGSAWQAIACGCPNLATAGSITGSSTFCPSAAGVSYSISSVSNATGYTWTVPTGATVTAGQGSTSITVTEGTVAGNVTVYASNNCGQGPTVTLAVTPITSASITTQPANAAAQTSNSFNTSFSVVASNATGYQWEVNTGSGYTAISNGGVYSNATTATLNITGATSGMNGYTYECIVSGPCNSITSSAATLSVFTCTMPSVQITLNNTAGTATASGLQVKLIINFANYAGDGLNATLNNVEFTTGSEGSGTPLYAWIESGSAPTATVSTETAPTSSSATAVVWVNLGSTTIGAGGSTNIYMNFEPSTVFVTSAVGASTGYTGEAPQWTGTSLPTYGEYDNGALVFPSFYDNFEGTALASHWSTTSGTTNTVSNKLTMTASHNWYGIYTNTFSAALNNISESYCELTGSTGGLCINTSGVPGSGNGINTGNTGVDAQFDDQSGQYGFGGDGSCTTPPGTNAQSATAVPSASTFYIYSFSMLTTPVSQISYGLFNSLTDNSASGASGPISSTSEVGLGVSSATGNFQWFRIRSYPPGGTLPTATINSYGCY